MEPAWLQSVWQWLEFAAGRLPELWLRTSQHLVLTGISTALAITFGLPLGILAYMKERLRTTLLAIIGVFQTIPSLAMLAILLALVGKIGVVPAIMALTLYALLPIVRNTVTGIEGVPAEIVEAARGIGMTRRQQLWMVQLPLATPVIIAGIRTATVVGVGIATLSAFIGAGGLGQFINRGLALSNTELILLGAIPAAVLAILVDGMIAAAAWGLQPVRSREAGTFKAKLKPAALAMPALLVAICFYAVVSTYWSDDSRPTVRIGSKDFTEQFILGELMAQMIEEHTDLGVDRRFNLGGTMICHEALAAGEIDLYAEYTGTGLVTVLDRPAESDPEKVLKTVRTEYGTRFDVKWLKTFGFDNKYALTVREADARENGWKTVSDLVPAADRLQAGFTAEFSERPDGYEAVQEAYGLQFGEVHDLGPALMYEAVSKGEVDVICAFATDGRIAAFDLQPLTDDRDAFPPYFAAPLVRSEFLEAHPEIRDVLERLSGRLDDQTMRDLNYQVDEKKRRPEDVAREFLEKQGLLR